VSFLPEKYTQDRRNNSDNLPKTRKEAPSESLPRHFYRLSSVFRVFFWFFSWCALSNCFGHANSQFPCVVSYDCHFNLVVSHDSALMKFSGEIDGVPMGVVDVNFTKD
jgi:hypothetical protein